MHFFTTFSDGFYGVILCFLVGFAFMYFLAYVLLQAQWGYAHFGIAFSRMHLRNFDDCIQALYFW